MTTIFFWLAIRCGLDQTYSVLCPQNFRISVYIRLPEPAIHISAVEASASAWASQKAQS